MENCQQIYNIVYPQPHNDVADEKIQVCYDNIFKKCIGCSSEHMSAEELYYIAPKCEHCNNKDKIECMYYFGDKCVMNYKKELEEYVKDEDQGIKICKNWKGNKYQFCHECKNYHHYEYYNDNKGIKPAPTPILP